MKTISAGIRKITLIYFALRKRFLDFFSILHKIYFFDTLLFNFIFFEILLTFFETFMAASDLDISPQNAWAFCFRFYFQFFFSLFFLVTAKFIFELLRISYIFVWISEKEILNFRRWKKQKKTTRRDVYLCLSFRSLSFWSFGKFTPKTRGKKIYTFVLRTQQCWTDGLAVTPIGILGLAPAAIAA